jgi:hypothetical protein
MNSEAMSKKTFEEAMTSIIRPHNNQKAALPARLFLINAPQIRDPNLLKDAGPKHRDSRSDLQKEYPS